MAIIISGTCGTNLNYTLDDNGLLEITGSGAMKNYTRKLNKVNVPWWSYIEYIEKIVISGATSIGNYAFYNCSSLTSITIPDSVTSIGDYAFYNCSRLKSITIPNSVTSIGSSAFYGCSSLQKVNYTGTIDNWCEISFVTYHSNPIFYTKNLYINDILLEDAVISTATSIGNYAFYNCSSLASVTIGSSVASIGGWTFYGCDSLKSITVNSNNVTYDSRSNCNAIITKETNILLFGCNNTQIPNDIVEIEAYAFGGSNIEEIILPETIKKIGDCAFENCYKLKKVFIPKSIEILGAGILNFFDDNNNYYLDNTVLQELYIPSSINYLESIFKEVFTMKFYLEKIIIINNGDIPSNQEFDNNNYSHCYSPWYWQNDNTPLIIELEEGIENILENSFYFEENRTNVDVYIPKTVINIDNNSFNIANQLTIYGYLNTAAEVYSINNKNNFVSLGYKPEDYFAEIKSISFNNKDTYLEEKSYNKENKINSKLPFKETYLQGYSYYNPELATWLTRDKDNITFADEIEENLLLSPKNSKVGFIGFGGYSLGKLPEEGIQWENSDNFNIENRYYYLDEYKTICLQFELENNTITDIISGEVYYNSFLVIEENTEETTEENTEGYIFILNSKIIEIIGTNSLKLADLFNYNILTAIPEENLTTFLDIPNSINGQKIQGIDLLDTPQSINQAILPINDTLILQKGLIPSTLKQYSNLRLIRGYPAQTYNLTEYSAFIETQDIKSNNLLILGKEFFKYNSVKDYNNLINNYNQIIYGNRTFSKSKLANFYIKNNDIYYNNDINFAIEDTPFLQSFIGNYTDLDKNYIDLQGILYNSEDETVNIKSFSNIYLVKNVIQSAPNDTTSGNVLKLSELFGLNGLKSDELWPGSTYNIKDYAFLSAQSNIHTLIFDSGYSEDNKIYSLENKALNLGSTINTKLKEIVVKDSTIPINKNVTSDWISVTNNASITIENTDFNQYKLFNNLNYSSLIIYTNNTIGYTFENLPNLTSFSLINIDSEEPCKIYLQPKNDKINIQTTLVGKFSLPIFNDNVVVESIDLSNGIPNYNSENSNIGGNYDSLQTAVISNSLCTVESTITDNAIRTNTSFCEEIKNNKLTSLTIINTEADDKKMVPYLSDKLQNLKELKIQSQGRNYCNKISFQAFINIFTLKNIYLSEHLFGDSKQENDCLICNQAFYGTSPKNIYIYINGKDKNGNSIEELQNISTDNYVQQLYYNELFSSNSPNNIFPYNSKMYLYDLNTNNTLFIGYYTGQTQESTNISDMELHTYEQIENWSVRINNDSNITQVTNEEDITTEE